MDPFYKCVCTSLPKTYLTTILTVFIFRIASLNLRPFLLFVSCVIFQLFDLCFLIFFICLFPCLYRKHCDCFLTWMFYREGLLVIH